MTLLTEPTRIVLSRTQLIPAVLGEPWGGGYFAGYISHTADGNPTHALIVAPRATGATGTGYTLTTNLQCKTTATTTAGTDSLFDGAANTAAIITAGIADHPAAQFCADLNTGGFDDWYWPATAELDIAFFHLKPGNVNNFLGYGINAYAVPKRDSNWTSAYPTQTYLTAFASGGTEPFAEGRHWASNQTTASRGGAVDYLNGFQGVSSSFTKTNLHRVRAFRRIAL